MTGSFVRRGSVAAALALAVLASATAIAQSRPAVSSAQARTPLRAMLYLTAPAGRRAPAGRPAPQRVVRGEAAIKQDLAALAWARADVAVVPWAVPGSPADARLTAVLATISASGAHVRAAALIDRRHGTEAAQLHALVKSRARSNGYLRVGSKVAVFVALADHSRRGCAESRRWRAAAHGLWLVQATFPGYGRCRAVADAWFRDALDARTASASGTFLIRPGAWPSGAHAAKLTRSPALWQRSIQQMTGSGAQLQMIDSLDDWAHGTAIEPSAAWPSESGFGTYLDALHALPPAVAAPGSGTPPGTGTPGGGTPAGGTPAAVPPTADPVVASGVTAREATLGSTVSAGSVAATWHVEYGLTSAYGQTTPPVALAAGTARAPVSVFLSSLTGATTYHARIVVASSAGTATSTDATFATLADSQAVRVAAAGDIACDPVAPPFNGGAGTPTECQQRAVSDAIIAGAYNAVLPLGDEQYNNGTAAQFAASYNPTWGRFKAISHPAIGNHEYGTPTLYYFTYFGAGAGDPAQGYYSYDLGSWHVVVINSNCARIGGGFGCDPGSAQETWLRADLAAHPARCTLAYFHHPRFSTGQAGDDLEMSTIWSDLVASGVEVVLTGHDHEYERFAPQNAAGARDDAHGAREFVVGTGGENHMSFKAAIKPNSEVRNATSFGFLSLSLAPSSYSWKFVSVPPNGFSDSGSASCH